MTARRRRTVTGKPDAPPTVEAVQPEWRPPGIWFALLRGYLAVFSAVAPHRGHARQEHRLIEGSIVDGYGYHRARGVSAQRAAWLAFREHVSELQPLAMVQKTRHDAGYAPRSRYPYWARLAAAPVGFLVVVAVALGVSSLAPAAEAEQGATVAEVFPAGHPRFGEVVEMGEFDTEREALFVASGGTVCLPPGVRAADLPPEVRANVLPTIAPGDTEACADLRPLLSAESE